MFCVLRIAETRQASLLIVCEPNVSKRLQFVKDAKKMLAIAGNAGFKA
jgi:hypothetical protein